MRFFLLALFAPLFLLFFGCENSVPEVISVNTQLVFDFRNETNLPSYRLSVFTETSNDIRRTASIRISNKLNGYEWHIENPVSINGHGRQWAGHAFLVYPNRAVFETGKYDVVYTDAAGKTSETSFTISYPDELLSAMPKDIPEILGDNWKENIAIFSNEGTLIYYDSRKTNWNSDSDIFSAFENARSFRSCYINAQGSILCMMVPVSRR